MLPWRAGPLRAPTSLATSTSSRDRDGRPPWGTCLSPQAPPVGAGPCSCPAPRGASRPPGCWMGLTGSKNRCLPFPSHHTPTWTRRTCNVERILTDEPWRDTGACCPCRGCAPFASGAGVKRCGPASVPRRTCALVGGPARATLFSRPASCALIAVSVRAWLFDPAPATPSWQYGLGERIAGGGSPLWGGSLPGLLRLSGRSPD